MDWRDQLSGLKVEMPQDEHLTEQTPDVPTEKLQVEPLRVELDKRNGKPATIVSGYIGSDTSLKELSKTLKIKCGAGGSSRDGEVLIQGDFRVKIADLLISMGYKVKKINFK